MICHACGEREGTIHVLEVHGGRQRSIWLCPRCAAGRADRDFADLPENSSEDPEAASGEPASLASFLGQVADGEGAGANLPPCPACGYTIQAFQASNRLGCPRCYVHFRDRILPILARYHRHASHLGKVPRQAGGAGSQQGAMTRLRVSLEKAIQGENYEEAARLRDVLRDMSGNGGGAGDGEPGGSR